MKKFTLLKSLLVVMALSLFSFSAVAETITIDFKDNSLSLPVKDAMSTNEMTFSVDGIEFGYKSVYYNTSKYAMFSKSAGVIYNKTSLGTINSISVTYTSGTSEKAKMNVSYGASVLNEIKTSGYVEQLDVTKSATKKTTQVATGDYFNLSVSNANNVQIETIVIDYVSSIEGGEGGGDVVDPDPEPDPEEPENNTEYVDELGRIVYPFGNHTDFASWTTGYSARSFDYKGATVSFESANKQSGTITDIPVTKGNYVQLELKDATKAITSVRLVCRQWTTKAQTITLNAGTSVAGLTNTNITSSNFVLETNELPINSSVVRFTFSSKDNQIGIDSIYYTIGDKEAVAIEQPTVSVVGGEKYEAFDVVLACATEGAEIYYTINGGAETKYTAAINIAATTELKTWSVKGSDKSDNLVVNYTFPTSVADIAALIADASGKNVRISGAVTVLAQTGKYLWVKDASASMLVYGTAPAEYNNGDQLIGLVGKVSTYSGAKQIVPTYFPTAIQGVAVEPTVVALADVVDGMVHQYIKLEGVTYTNATTLTAGDNTLTMYNRFNYTYAGEEGDKVNVVAIVGYYNALQVYPISIEKVETPTDPTSVENTKLADIYTLNRTIVAEGEFQIFTVTGQNVTDMNGNLEKGIYVVRTANATAKVVVK